MMGIIDWLSDFSPVPNFELVFYHLLLVILASLTGAGWGLYYKSKISSSSKNTIPPIKNNEEQSSVISDPNYNQCNSDNSREIG